MLKEILKKCGIEEEKTSEIVKAMNEATVNNYKNNGIKEYEIMAFLDGKTSKICKSMDGEVVNVKDAVPGKNMPPFHWASKL